MRRFDDIYHSDSRYDFQVDVPTRCYKNLLTVLSTGFRDLELDDMKQLVHAQRTRLGGAFYGASTAVILIPGLPSSTSDSMDLSSRDGGQENGRTQLELEPGALHQGAPWKDYLCRVDVSHQFHFSCR